MRNKLKLGGRGSAHKFVKTKWKKETKPKKAKSLKTLCDEKWAYLVKLRAGFKSELSGKEGKQIGGESVLHAHHINGKPNLFLRYLLDNGICLTAGEHKFGIHNQGRQKDYEEKIKAVRGTDIYERYNKKTSTKSDLKMMLIYLESEIKNLEGETK